MPRHTVAVSLLIASLALAVPTRAQVATQTLEPTPASAAAPEPSIGIGIDMLGDLLVTGRQRDNDPLHIWRKNAVTGAWELEQAIRLNELPYPPTPPFVSIPAPSNAHVGLENQIAVGVDRFVVGVDIPQKKTEIVQVYAKTPIWEVETILEPIAPADPENFGNAVAISEGWIAVAGESDGVWLYELTGSGWIERQVIAPPPLSSSFGTNVALDGNVLVVLDRNFTDAVYVYELIGATWTLVRTVAHPNTTGSLSVAIDGPTLAYGDGFSSEVTVVERTGASWANAVTTTTLAPFGGNSPFPIEFSRGIDISGPLIAIGPGNNSLATMGSIFLFEKIEGAWYQVQRFAGPAPISQASTGFALELAIDGEEVATAAFFDEDGVGAKDGRAYVLDVSQRPSWVNVGHSLSGGGGAPLLEGFGNIQTPLLNPAQVEDLRLYLTNGLPNAAAFLVAGAGGAVELPYKGGVLVPDPVFNFPIAIDAAGDFALNVVLDPPLMSDVLFHCQIWILDPSGPVGYTASNGVRVTGPDF